MRIRWIYSHVTSWSVTITPNNFLSGMPSGWDFFVEDINNSVTAHADQWPITKATLEWNDSQIFRDKLPAGRVVREGEIYYYQGEHVCVVLLGKGQQHRVAILNAGDPHCFWRTKTVSEADLQPCPDPVPSLVMPTLPRSGSTYIWLDLHDGLPPIGEPHSVVMGNETPIVVVGRSSWRTTRVRLSTDPRESRGFLVYTHAKEMLSS